MQSLNTLIIIKFKIEPIKWFCRQNYGLKIATITILSIFAYFLYAVKIESSNGRILIWKNTVSLIKENIISGGGYDSFNSRYMNSQGDYFRMHPNSSYAVYSSNVKYAFNEPLRLWSEHGLLGITMLFLMFVSIFNTPNNNRILVASKASLIAILGFSLFSYPLAIIPIKLVIVLCLAMIAHYQNIVWKFSIKQAFSSSVFKVFTCCIIAILITLNIIYIELARKSLRMWYFARTEYSAGNYINAYYSYKENYSIQKDNGVFLLEYGKTLYMLGRDKEAIKILTIAAQKENSVLIQITLGECYQRTKKFKLSEKAYFNAHYMIPDKLYPEYLLVKLYIAMDNKGKALVLAKKLISKKVKVNSEASVAIKNEMERLIQIHM